MNRKRDPAALAEAFDPQQAIPAQAGASAGWRPLPIRNFRDQGVAGSNPVAPTNELPENKGPRENDLGPLFLKVAPC
jgi:hypothetical protein